MSLSTRETVPTVTLAQVTRAVKFDSGHGSGAGGTDAKEKQAVEESFAKSVIWGFTVQGMDGEAIVIDGTDFFLRDAHGIGARLAAAGEGSYSVDASRSAIFMPRTKAFPDNTAN